MKCIENIHTRAVVTANVTVIGGVPTTTVARVRSTRAVAVTDVVMIATLLDNAKILRVLASDEIRKTAQAAWERVRYVFLTEVMSFC